MRFLVLLRQLIFATFIFLLTPTGWASTSSSAPVYDLNQSNVIDAEENNANSETIIAADDNDQPLHHEDNKIVKPITDIRLSPEEKIARLEQQLQNIIQMNLPQQLNNLQQQMGQLNGQIQQLAHDLDELKNQNRSPATAQLNEEAKLQSNPTSQVSTNAADNSSQSEEIKIYQNAFELLTKKQYSQAQYGFEKYLKTYSNGGFAANAHYWLAEILFTQKKSVKALAEYTLLIEKYPTSAKVSDAQLKIAMIDVEQGRISKALEGFKKVQKQFPKTTAAQLATIQLQQLESRKE